MGHILQKLGKKRKEVIILMMGLDGAGRKTILYYLQGAGAQDKINSLWKHNLSNTLGIIFVVDSDDRGRIDEASSELQLVLENNQFGDFVILVLANKQDIPNSMSIAEIIGIMDLTSLPCPWTIQPTCALNDNGIFEGLNWLSNALKKKFSNV